MSSETLPGVAAELVFNHPAVFLLLIFASIVMAIATFIAHKWCQHRAVTEAQPTRQHEFTVKMFLASVSGSSNTVLTVSASGQECQVVESVEISYNGNVANRVSIVQKCNAKAEEAASPSFAMQQATLHHLPVSLQMPTLSWLQRPKVDDLRTPYQDREQYQSCLAVLAKRKNPRWREQLLQVFDTLETPFCKDGVLAVIEQHPIVKQMVYIQLHHMLQTILASIRPFLRATAVLESCIGINPDEIEPHLSSCHKHYHEFEKAQEEVLKFLSEKFQPEEVKPDPEEKRGQEACFLIRKAGRILRLHGEGEIKRLDRQCEKAIANLEVLGSYYCAAQHWLQMLPFLIILIRLDFDLSPCKDVLEAFLKDSSDDFLQCYPRVASIIGSSDVKELAKNVQPNFIPSTTVSTINDTYDHVHTLASICYVVLILLIAKATGYKVDSAKALKKTVQVYTGIPLKDDQVEASLQLSVKLTRAMYREVLDYREYVIEAGNRLSKEDAVEMLDYIEDQLKQPDPTRS